jgi:hypothetical protein
VPPTPALHATSQMWTTRQLTCAARLWGISEWDINEGGRASHLREMAVRTCG